MRQEDEESEEVASSSSSSSSSHNPNLSEPGGGFGADMFIRSTARMQLLMVTGRLGVKTPGVLVTPVTDTGQKTHLRQYSDSEPVTVRYEGLVDVTSEFARATQQ